jgi:glycosyltransferase involved in cell wall biosynthesis
MTNSLIGISVVIPSFNQGRFIEDAIRSLLDQLYPNLEVFVVDGGSTDDTIERLKRYGDRVQWVSEPDEGQSDAIAKGFSRVTNPWMTWLNSDDVQCNNALWAVAEAVEKDPAAEVIAGRGPYMDEDGNSPRPYPTISVGLGIDVRKEMFEKGYVAQPSVFFRRTAYDAVGGIDRKLQFCMDYDLWARFALHGCRFVGIDRDMSGNRWYETTKSVGRFLDLASEVTATQVNLFGRVSPYFVQTVSDNLYHRFHSVQFGEANQMLYRLLYFKTVWVWFNARQPLYCLKGLLFETIAKSSPVVNDKLTWAECWRGIVGAVVRGLRRV